MLQCARKLLGLFEMNAAAIFADAPRSLVELLELLNFSRLLIRNDNGLIHFASLTPTPIVALFSTD